MPSLKHDLGYVQECLTLLNNYLLSKDIYWSLGGSPPDEGPSYPQMTLGGILLALTRLQARKDELVHQSEIQRYENEIAHIKMKWQVAWIRKAKREFSARIKLWRNFLQEYRDDPGNHRDRYSYEVSRRVMLHLLERDAHTMPDEEIEMLNGLDRLLQAIFIEGEFIWDEDLKGGFPRNPYWYLYGWLKG